jgi:hypothetical protein
MTKSECRMAKQIRMTKNKKTQHDNSKAAVGRSFELRYSFVIRHSGFVISLVSLHVKAKRDYIAIFHDVIFPFNPQFAGLARLCE